MLGISFGAQADWNGRPTPWNRPSRSNSLSSVHGFEHFVGREIVDLDDQILAQAAEMLGKPGIGIRRQNLDIGQRGRRNRPPGQRIVEFPGHTVF